MMEELLPADEKLLRAFGGENIFVDVAGNCTRSPNAAAIVSQSRYLPAKNITAGFSESEKILTKSAMRRKLICRSFCPA